MIDVESTIISQYGTSSTIGQLVANMNENIDPRADFDAFYDYIWNVNTAQYFGLDIWGRIVNIGRELQIPDVPLYFGFDEAYPDFYPFDEQPFYNGVTATKTYVLGDTAYRKLVLLKALTNISATTITSLNQLLQNYFADRGRCYVVETGVMQGTYAFEFLLDPVEFAIMTQSKAIPRPAGVVITITSPYP